MVIAMTQRGFCSAKTILIGVSIPVIALVVFVGISRFSLKSHQIKPRQNAEAKISLGVLPDKGIVVTFGFPPISEKEVNSLRKNIRASIIPEGSGEVWIYEPGDLYPDGSGNSYTMLRAYTDGVRPHFLKLEFLNQEKWPENVVITVENVGL